MEYTKNASLEEIQEKYKKSEFLSSSLSSTDSESSSSISNHKQSFDQYEEEEKNLTTNSHLIKEVFDENFEEAFKEINTIINDNDNNYNYIGMDTEFPGVVYNLEKIKKDFYYKTLKINVNSTKLIQLGISFTNKKGEFSNKYKYHTFQFNFKFDEEKDKYSQESINLLKTNGINFEKLKTNGIKPEDFKQKLLLSGLVLNPHCHWISYQGSYDFAYLLKILISDNLPETEDEFSKLLNLYFPSFYDVRMLTRDDENFFYGGLNKLIANLDIERKGINHQAGSDAIATIEAFHQLRENGIINNEKLKTFKNVLYGLGIGEDNENTIKYIKNNINVNFKRFNSEDEKMNRCNYNNGNINTNINMMNIRPQNYLYNNMVVNNNSINSINSMMLLQQIQNQKQLNNLISFNNINNNYLQYALYNSYQKMRNNILINNMKLTQINA